MGDIGGTNNYNSYKLKAEDLTPGPLARRLFGSPPRPSSGLSIYIYIYMYICIHMNICICTYIHFVIHEYIYIYM